MAEDSPATSSSNPPKWRVEGGPAPNRDRPSKAPAKRRRLVPDPRDPFWRILLIFFALNVIFAWVSIPRPRQVTVSYTFFREQVLAGNVAEVTTKGDTIQGVFRQPLRYPDEKATPTDKFKTERPSLGDDGIILVLEDKNLPNGQVNITARPAISRRSTLETVMFAFGPTLLLAVFYIFVIRRMAGGALGRLPGMGRSRAVLYDSSKGTRTTFADVAGIDEAEDELVEIVDFLKNPDKYRKLGAKIPKGVLLAGPPGTGKTLLAKAVAGEANVPFFSMSASEFVEMIVGVGASRVRDLFEQAKTAAPAIIFIDEIDAIGRARGGGFTGGVNEQEQTLNQILTEMDGFTGSEGVIVVAATNRMDVLDPALLRPGRFDRHVIVNPPDQKGREQILRIHSRDVPLADDVDLAGLAGTTPGMVGADLRNLVNEAALLAARIGHERVTQADFTNAMEKIVLGAERKITLTPEERRRTAFHESGHALLGILFVGADPVRKVSIIPRGGALGVTFQSPSTDRYGYDEQYLKGRIVMALGGRAAEFVVFGNVTTGAESDLEMCTRIARSMVGRWGMSEAIGPVSVLPSVQEMGPFGPLGPSVSGTTLRVVDDEVRRIIEGCYEQAKQTLLDNRARLDALANSLLERETLDEADVYAVVGLPAPPRPGTEAVVTVPEIAPDVTPAAAAPSS